MKNYTPREIVSELDRYIVGQHQAKRAVAIALRNRWRRQQVPGSLREEITPKNIIMIGPTGVGKTEIARRLAKLAGSPFIKVEVTKYTEVGYVGKDVESMIRDLTEIAVKMMREESTRLVRSKAESLAEERLLDLLLPPVELGLTEPGGSESPLASTREKLRTMLRKGELDHREVELEVPHKTSPSIEIFPIVGNEEFDLREMMSQFLPRRAQKRRVKVPEALLLLTDIEASKLIDGDEVNRQAIGLVEESGIVFLDEIDKICGPESSHGPQISREGVQRDLLPIVEGSQVTTKYGTVRTDHILFIAAGAFSHAKPSDLIPELQGRFPIRVELESLKREEMVRILSEPENALTVQYRALLATEGVDLTFSEDAIAEIASMACEINEQTENIGARRLHTVMERLLDEISFNAPDGGTRKIDLGAKDVRDRLADLVKNQDLSRYIL